MTVIDSAIQETGGTPVAILREICRFDSGGTPDRANSDFYGGTTPWISGADIASDGSLSPRSQITELALTRSAARVVDRGTILLVTRTSVGKVAIAPYPVSFSQDITAIAPSSEALDTSYLVEFLKSQQAYFTRNARGATIKGITRDVVRNLSIPLPPLPEQRRIAAILDRAGHLRTQRREAIAHLDTLTQSIFNDMFGDPARNERGHPTVPLMDIGHLYSGGTPSKSNPALWAGDVPWFSPKDIKEPHLADSIDHIAAAAYQGSSLRLLPADTIVFVVRGMILVHSFPVAMLKTEATINQDLKAIRLTMPFNAKFLLAALSGQKEHVLSLVETSAHGTKRLSAQGIEQIQILNPPLELQQTFARRVAGVERLKDQHRAQVAELDTLFASLQNRAFKGEL